MFTIMTYFGLPPEDINKSLVVLDKNANEKFLVDKGLKTDIST